MAMRRGGGGRGRGRGRGRASHYTFDIKALLGDDTSMLNFDGEPKQPPPTFETLNKLPVPLRTGPIECCKCNIRSHSIAKYKSTYSISNSTKKCVDKFRDRFTVRDPGRFVLSDRRLLADDRFSSVKTKSKKIVPSVACIKKGKKRFKAGVPVINDDDDMATEENPDDPERETNAEKKDSDEEEEELVAEDEEEEEDEEQITDYISSYFDNGEDYLDDDDDKFDDSMAW